jgi:hypothetical protein
MAKFCKNCGKQIGSSNGGGWGEAAGDSLMPSYCSSSCRKSSKGSGSKKTSSSGSLGETLLTWLITISIILAMIQWIIETITIFLVKSWYLPEYAMKSWTIISVLLLIILKVKSVNLTKSYVSRFLGVLLIVWLSRIAYISITPVELPRIALKSSQVNIKVTATNTKGDPVANVKVYLEDDYTELASTGEYGTFSKYLTFKVGDKVSLRSEAPNDYKILSVTNEPYTVIGDDNEEEYSYSIKLESTIKPKKRKRRKRRKRRK